LRNSRWIGNNFSEINCGLREKSKSIAVRTENLPGDDYDYSENNNNDFITSDDEKDD